ncbi:MAG: cytochrome c [Pseudomonadota bacterium]
MKKRGLAALGALALGGALLVGGRWFGLGGAAAYAPDLARGEAIYAEACASCHGAALEGEPDWRTRKPNGRLPAPPHDESGHTWHHPDSVLLEITARGTAAVVGGGYESDMPGFGEAYSEDELRDVLAWIKSQWPEPIQARQEALTAQDEARR